MSYSDNTDDESASAVAAAVISKSRVSLAVEQFNFPWPDYSKYFKVLRIIDDCYFYKKLEIKCLACVGIKILKVDTRSNSNLRKHLSVSIII